MRTRRLSPERIVDELWASAGGAPFDVTVAHGLAWVTIL
jgi:hypothetical protein